MKKMISATVLLLVLLSSKAQTTPISHPLMDSVAEMVCTCIMMEAKANADINRTSFMTILSGCIKKHMMPVVTRLAAEDGTDLKDPKAVNLMSAKLGAQTSATCPGMKELVNQVNKKTAENKPTN